MSDTRDPPVEMAPIEAIAAGLRDALGVPIEAQPGLRDPDEAGQVNIAFRVVIRTILRHGLATDQTVSEVLLRLARRRLEAGLLDAREVEHLLRLECEGREDWLAYLILIPWSEVEHLLATRGPEA